jgi:hypothetical protein
MVNLVPYENGHLVPNNHTDAGIVIAFPGSNRRNYHGAAVLALTPNAVVLCSPADVIAEAPLSAIEDVVVKRFEGILIPHHSSAGTRLAPPFDNFGIEVTYSLDIRPKARLKALTVFASLAHEWENLIRDATEQAQLELYGKLKIRHRNRPLSRYDEPEEE